MRGGTILAQCYKKNRLHDAEKSKKSRKLVTESSASGWWRIRQAEGTGTALGFGSGALPVAEETRCGGGSQSG